MIETLTAVWPGLLALVEPVHGAVSGPAAPLWSAASLVSLATLAALEIVLGIDNVIFIAILSGRLPKDQQPRARRLGIAMAVISRLALLLGITTVLLVMVAVRAPAAEAIVATGAELATE